MANKAYSLSHTKWMCKYHIVFTPKYRRKVIYNQIRSDVGEILRRLCEYKGVEIIEGHLMPDHVHMLVAIPPKYSVSSVMGYLKGKSSLMIFGLCRKSWCKPSCRGAAVGSPSGRQFGMAGGWALRRNRGI